MSNIKESKSTALIHSPIYFNEMLGHLNKYEPLEQCFFTRVFLLYMKNDGDLKPNSRELMAYTEEEIKAVKSIWNEATTYALQTIEKQKPIRDAHKKGANITNAKRKVNNSSLSVTLSDSLSDPDSVTQSESESELELELKLDPEQKNIYISSSECKGEEFVKPTVEQVSDYCKEHSLVVTAKRFWHFYEGNDWKVNGKFINWQEKCHTWKESNADTKKPQSQLEMEEWKKTAI